MLGRTLNRDGSVIDGGDICDLSAEKSSLRGSILATLQKKLISNASTVLFDLLAKTDSKDAINAASEYLSIGLYQLYRIYHHLSGGKDSVFSLEGDIFMLDGAGVVMKKAELRLIRALRAAEKVPALTAEGLIGDYPGLSQSVNQVLQNGDTVIRDTMEIDR